MEHCMIIMTLEMFMLSFKRIMPNNKTQLLYILILIGQIMSKVLNKALHFMLFQMLVFNSFIGQKKMAQ